MTVVTPAAHGRGGGGRWTVPLLPRLLSGGLPSHALHRVQRRARNLSLLRQQVLLLAGYHRRQRPVRKATECDSEGGQSALARVPLSGVYPRPVSAGQPACDSA